jgi:TetR/AcrR family transcriptional repressor of nem operon
MGRPRTFDPNTAVSAATDEFWRRGFGGTSVRDLANAMCMTGASIYNAYGDKRALFQVCIDHYLRNYVRLRIAELDESEDPIDGLKAFFDALVDASLCDPRGCLLVNSAIDIAPWDPEIAGTIRSCLREIEDGFDRAVSRTHHAKRNESRTAARLLLSAVISLRVLARAGGDEERIRTIARSAVASVDTSLFASVGADQRANADLG